MKEKRLFMETTKISVSQTAQKIGALLGEHGATHVLTSYGADRTISELGFRLAFAGKLVPILLPIRVDAVYQVLWHRRGPRCRWSPDEIMEQAARVAWRQALRWLEAQLAFSETGMVELMEVFLPYVQTGARETLFRRMVGEGQFEQLPAPKDE